MEQVGALCWRPSLDGIEVLLITSRDTGRWIIPKGGLIDGMDAANSAQQEAWEEAGVEGELTRGEALGSFDYDKLLRKRTVARRCCVAVYSLRVERLAEDFPERAQRQRQWFAPAEAAARVQERDLSRLFEALAHAPHRLTGARPGDAAKAG